MPNSWTEADAREALVRLYLRLNGYFVTSLIIHSAAPGRNQTQIDALAVRHQFQGEPRRGVPPSQFLAPNSTDVLICEVKNKKARKFNAALVSQQTLAEALQWVGIWDKADCDKAANQLSPLMSPPFREQPMRRGITVAGATIRTLLCAPGHFGEHHAPSGWVLTGDEIFRYARKCLSIAAAPMECSRTYDYGAWGEFRDIVRFFKERDFNGAESIGGLYSFLGCEDETPAPSVIENLASADH